MAVQKLEHVYMRKGRGQWRRMTRGRGRAVRVCVQQEGPAFLENGRDVKAPADPGSFCESREGQGACV